MDFPLPESTWLEPRCTCSCSHWVFCNNTSTPRVPCDFADVVDDWEWADPMDAVDCASVRLDEVDADRVSEVSWVCDRASYGLFEGNVSNKGACVLVFSCEYECVSGNAWALRNVDCTTCCTSVTASNATFARDLAAFFLGLGVLLSTGTLLRDLSRLDEDVGARLPLVDNLGTAVGATVEDRLVVNDCVVVGTVSVTATLSSS